MKYLLIDKEMCSSSWDDVTIINQSLVSKVKKLAETPTSTIEKSEYFVGEVQFPRRTMIIPSTHTLIYAEEGGMVVEAIRTVLFSKKGSTNLAARSGKVILDYDGVIFVERPD